MGMCPSWQTGHRRPETKSWLCNTPAAVTATSNASSARVNRVNLLTLRSNPGSILSALDNEHTVIRYQTQNSSKGFPLRTFP
jgi:hypothetical protein